MGAVQRLQQFIETKEISKYRFYQNTGLSNGSLDKGENIGSDRLLTGKGSPVPRTSYCDNELAKGEVEVVQNSKSAEPLDERSVTLYDISAAANLKTVFDNKTQNILGEITMPNIPRCDGAIHVRGDSMYPLLKSGDIVGYKEIFNFENVIYGEMYIVAYDIEGDEYVCVKYVNHSERDGYIKLVSYNPHHDPRTSPSIGSARWPW